MADTRDPSNTADLASITWDAYRYGRAVYINEQYLAHVQRAGKPTAAYAAKVDRFKAAIAALPLPVGATVGFWTQPTYQSGEALVEIVGQLLYDGYGNADSPYYIGSTPLPVAEVDTVAKLLADNGQWDDNPRFTAAIFEAQANGDAGNPPVARDATFMADYGVPWVA